MKITKARLRQIIEEELLKEDEAAEARKDAVARQKVLKTQLQDVTQIGLYLDMLKSQGDLIREAANRVTEGELDDRISKWHIGFTNSLEELAGYLELELTDITDPNKTS